MSSFGSNPLSSIKAMILDAMFLVSESTSPETSMWMMSVPRLSVKTIFSIVGFSFILEQVKTVASSA